MSFLNAPAPTGPVCAANISDLGRRRRRNMGIVGGVVTVIALVGCMVFHVPWTQRLAVGLLAAGAATGWLQARRDTCIARAVEGAVEHNDFTSTPAPADDVRASRAMAVTIVRDSALIGLAVATLAAASAWIA